MSDVIKRIEDCYNSLMWFDESLYQKCMVIAKAQSWSTTDFERALSENRDAKFASFKKVFTRMGNKKNYYNIVQKIYKVGDESEIRITCKYNYQKIVGKYKVVISPFYNYGYSAMKPFSTDEIYVEADENTITIPYSFPWEDMYAINIYLYENDEELYFLTYNVYAVDSDLYELSYYKADLHMHTTFSDGYEPPELVVASARENGMDIVAITDHNAFAGSIAAKKVAKDLGLDLTVLLGEEYALEYSPMHILALGLEEEINRSYLTKAIFEKPRTKEILQEPFDLSCDKYAYAGTQVLLEEIEMRGGISILAHPFWKPISPNGYRMDTPENLFLELGKNKKFTGIELVSGSSDGECNVANMQSALARTMVGDFSGIPLIGITDSHYYSSDPICGRHYTIIFSRSKLEEDVLLALRTGKCVAVEHVDKTSMCYGDYRYVKFANFLTKYYFTEHDEFAYQEAKEIKKKLLVKY